MSFCLLSCGQSRLQDLVWLLLSSSYSLLGAPQLISSLFEEEITVQLSPKNR